MDANYRIVAANKAYSAAFSPNRAVAGLHCYEVSHRFDAPCDQTGEPCPLRMSQESGRPQRVLHCHHTPKGEEHVDVETTPIRDNCGDIVFFVETMRVVKQASGHAESEGLVGSSPKFLQMLAFAVRVAPTSAAVLLQGETGTGKELVAKMLHEKGSHPNGPFVPVDCSGLTESLFESELFGYEKGAFTGASHRKMGLVEAANGGTLFLDEVGDIPLSLQVKLLRLLESGTYRRVGGVDILRTGFRLVCATHRNLAQMVEKETFRRDLYYRISTFPIQVPNLAERKTDIPMLVTAFLKRVADGQDFSLTPQAIQFLQQREYSGNIRELRNIIERATILADGKTITEKQFEPMAQPSPSTVLAASSSTAFIVDEPAPLEDVERRYIAWAESMVRGNREDLAQRLRLSRRTLFRKLAKSSSCSTSENN
ncbi:sigma54 specific transcriptional regulator, Fis family [Propionivibrio dicarboxylicus]|uniref:Sigma54 specific transcriptional regulator, Fis family n=2 Tax=Propionivibrio dicarboxylicus TaxID=83767 RepID=A0A1G8EYC2_9RHOO|nr:sigma54 specific transcriptional regulator, Fis family [Propionivibrio dicarboxylicus]